MSIPLTEQETTFLIDGLDSKFVDCYSCSVVYVRRLAKIATDLGIEYTVPFEGAIRVRLPITCLLLRPPRKVSEEFRAAARERAKEMRAVRMNGKASVEGK